MKRIAVIMVLAIAVIAILVMTTSVALGGVPEPCGGGSAAWEVYKLIGICVPLP